MKTQIRPHRIRTIALLLTGVLPLAAQPAAFAGRIAASRYVDRMVGDQPGKVPMEELIRLLREPSGSRTQSRDAEPMGDDVMAVVIQCKLLSLFSDSALLQATDVDAKPVSLGTVPHAQTAPASHVVIQDVVLTLQPGRPAVRRLSDEQPLGP